MLDRERETLRIAGDQTFTPEHAYRVFNVLAAYVHNNDAAILYRASYSENFGADLRAIMRKVFLPEVIKGWETDA